MHTCGRRRKCQTHLHPEWQQMLHDNVKHLRGLLAEVGIIFTASASHIIRIPIGDIALYKSIADRLLDHYGIYLQPVNHPTVSVGKNVFVLLLLVAIPKNIF